MNAILDSGALVAIDRRDRRVGAMLRVYQQAGVPVLTSNAVVAQVWRNGARQANLARTLRGVRTEAIDDNCDKAVGSLLGEAGTSDVVDGHVALLAASGDAALTNDPHDLAHLLAVRNVDATIVHV
ncbi:MAG TPA: hypothetical protein VFZ72_12865 [Jiangellaceae bacterium]